MVSVEPSPWVWLRDAEDRLFHAVLVWAVHADVWVPAPRTAVTTVPIWVNHAGVVSTEPNPRAEGLRDATIGAIQIGVAGLLVVVGMWALMHIGLTRELSGFWHV